MPPIFEPLTNVEEERRVGDFSVGFETWGPTAWEQSGTLFTVDAISSALTRGKALGYTNPVAAAVQGFFGESATVEAEGTGRILTPEDANVLYGIEENGQKLLTFTKPIGTSEAKEIHADRVEEIARLKQLQTIDGFGPNLMIMGIDVLREMNDPVGIVSMFFPAFKGYSFAKGFASGAIGAGISITPGTIIGHKYHRDFQTRQAIQTVLFGGVFAGGISSFLGVVNRSLGRISDKAEKIRLENFKEFVTENVKEDGPPMDLESLELAAAEVLQTGEAEVSAAIAQLKSLRDVEHHRRTLFSAIEDVLKLKKNLKRMQDGPDKDRLTEIFDARIAALQDQIADLTSVERDIQKKGYGDVEKQQADRKKRMQGEEEADPEIVRAKQELADAEKEFIEAKFDFEGKQTGPALERLEAARVRLAELEGKQPKITRVEDKIDTGKVEEGTFDEAAVIEKNKQRQADLDRLEDQLDLALGGNKKAQFMIRQVLAKLFPTFKKYFNEGPIDEILARLKQHQEAGGFKIHEVEVETIIDEGPSGTTRELNTRVLSATDRKDDLGNIFSGKAIIFQKEPELKPSDKLDDDPEAAARMLKEREEKAAAAKAKFREKIEEDYIPNKDKGEEPLPEPEIRGKLGGDNAALIKMRAQLEVENVQTIEELTGGTKQDVLGEIDEETMIGMSAAQKSEYRKKFKEIKKILKKEEADAAEANRIRAAAKETGNCLTDDDIPIT